MNQIDFTEDFDTSVPDVFDVISGRNLPETCDNDAREIVSHCERCGRVTEQSFTIAGPTNCC